MKMNEDSDQSVATIISVFLWGIGSITNHVPASITSPAISRNRTTSALNMGAPVCVHLVINQTACYLIKPPAATGQSHSSPKFACPGTAAPAAKISDGPTASGG